MNIIFEKNEERNKRKTALVTGASGEIGSVIALSLAKNKMNLILQYNNNYEKASQVLNICKQYNADTYLVKADFSKIDSIDKLFNEIMLKRIHPNVLINCAGIANYGLIQDISYEDWQKIININLMSTFFCTQKVIPEMIKQKYGRIINISSVWGEKGAANEVAYSMTKGAINTFTKASAQELAPSGITVNSIAPGIVNSKMMSEFTEEELQILKNDIPLNRFASPIEIAQCVLYLLHKNSSYITGQVIKIDGGWQ